MNLQDEIVRSLIRGLGWRVARSTPWWLAAAIFAVLFALGSKGTFH